MRRTTIAGLCLAAVLGVIAADVASASAAEPEYLACVKASKVAKKYTGKYTTKTCSTEEAKGEGKYERGAAKFPVKFKGKSGEALIYEFAPKENGGTIHAKLECKKDKDEGDLTNSREGTAKITYEGCESKGALAGPCTSMGMKVGVIVSEPLVTKLVWLDEHESVPGIALEAATHGGQFVKKVECANGAESAEQFGSLVGKVSPIGESSKLITVTFAANPEHGFQEFEGFWEGAAFMTDTLTTNFSGLQTQTAVPTSESSVEVQKGGAILVS